MKVGDFSYFAVLVVLIGLFIGIYFLLRNKKKDTQFKVLYIWCWVNFALHFLKQLFYWDVAWFKESGFVNICATSVLVFPFIMMIKKDSFLKDFMYFIGVVGGFAACVYPTEVLGKSLWRFESIRFYACHFSLLAIPLLMAIFNIYRPRMKMWWTIPLSMVIYQVILAANTAIYCFGGVVTREGFTPLQLFLDRQYQNSSFTFGPTPDMGIASEIFDFLTPKFMKYTIPGNGRLGYWPVVWLIIPTYVILVPIYFLIGFPFWIKKKKPSKE